MCHNYLTLFKQEKTPNPHSYSTSPGGTVWFLPRVIFRYLGIPLRNGSSAKSRCYPPVHAGARRLRLTVSSLLQPSGRLVDALKNYEVIFYLAGSEVVLSALFLAMATYCCLNRGKKKEPPPENNPSVGGGSDTEEAESDVQEAEEHSSDNHQPAHSTDNAMVAASEEANHVADEQSGEGGGCPVGDGEVLARDGCNADQTVERDSF